jgi:enoyl-CoA hydratase/carnithine racemase
VKVSVADGIMHVRLSRAHGNAINDPLLEGLVAAFQEAGADDAVRGVLLGANGKLFCPGLDLQELIAYDRPAMERFVNRFAGCLLELYRFPKPLVAALSGHTLAGGCVLAMTADWRNLKRDALIGFNEVRVGVPLPFGVTQILRQSVHGHRAEEIALLGRNYANEEAVATGLAHELLPEERFEEGVRARLTEFVEKNPRAFARTKEYLRHATVEAFLAGDARRRGEFLAAWFSPETRRRMESIVDDLRRRGG